MRCLEIFGAFKEGTGNQSSSQFHGSSILKGQSGSGDVGREKSLTRSTFQIARTTMIMTMMGTMLEMAIPCRVQHVQITNTPLHYPPNMENIECNTKCSHTHTISLPLCVPLPLITSPIILITSMTKSFCCYLLLMCMGL